jgi:hypothetical protein
MFLQHKPIPGYWYSNFSGQLLQVRAVVFLAGKRSRIILEDINGKRESVDFESWRRMDLVLHSPVALDRQDEVLRDL